MRNNGNGNAATREITGFYFQEIPLEEAMNVVLAGDGAYSEVKQTLLEKLPALPKDKAFAFGLENGKEVPEDQRRGLCMAINMTLKKARFDWRITYSESRKLFVCIPRSAKPKSQAHTNGYIDKESDDEMVLKLRGEGKKVPQIHEIMPDFPLKRIKYLCYHVAAGIRNRPLPPTSPGPRKMDDDRAKQEMEAMIQEACRLFKVTPELIAQGAGRCKAVRKAICVVACLTRNIAPRIISPYVGIGKNGVKFNSRQNTRFAKVEIAKLKEIYGR